MVQFADIEGLEVVGTESKPFEFQMANKRVATVWFKPALEENTEYADGSLLYAQKKGRDANTKGKKNIRKQMARARREDMALFAKYCADKWENVTDIKGNEVPFTTKNAFEFLTQIPHRYQDALRGWIRQSRNFLQDNDDAPTADESGSDDFDLDDLDDIVTLDDLDDAIEDAKNSDGEDSLEKP